MYKSTSVFLLAALLPAVSVQAIETRYITDPAGRPVFEVRYFDVGEGPYIQDDEEPAESVWPWNQNAKDLIARGLEYWAEVLPLPAGAGPAIIHIGTDSETGNAFGGSFPGENGEDFRTLIQRHFQGLPVSPDELLPSGHAFFGLGPSEFPENYRFSQIPITGKDDLVSTAIHELAHGLGVMNAAHDADGDFTPEFAEVLSGWAPLLVDDNGRPARPGQAILCHGCENPYDPEAFDARADRSMLVGPHISDALEGGLPGIPVSMYAMVRDVVRVDDNYMSHSELRNGMMSHQAYRNYTGFMEAELAVLQDIGYTLDRRNFYGRSVYGSGLDIINDRGYFARDATGSQYLPGQYNRATLGLGLHVYGSDNRVRQVADLLSAGEGGAGIRVDGVGNTIVIDPGVRVHANGPGGQGIMFTYGKNHELVQRGDIEATGPGGVGVRFDFGNNALMDSIESRGSYHRTVDGKPAVVLPELQGPLVRAAHISGRVAGSDAAILISANAHVGGIHVMQGAELQGDIVSHYAGRDETGQARLTTLSFGRAADVSGNATSQADPGFRLSYAGDIVGRDNLALSFDGGATRLLGQHQVHGVAVAPGALLAGESSFQLASGSQFANHGTLAPGGSIGRMRIEGDFIQSASGVLLAEFNAGGAHDVLEVSGTLDLAGTLALAPQPGWYDSDWNLQANPVAAAAGQNAEFDTVAVVHGSPVLGFNATALGEQRYQLAAARAPDAYSQYGSNANEKAAGRALQLFAGRAPADAQPFFSALDFSAPDGSDVGLALAQVSPQGYSAGLAASLLRERDVLENALRGFADGLETGSTQWKGFAVAFGGEGRQDARDTAVAYNASTYGLIIGGGRSLGSQPDLSVGMHLDIAEQSVKLQEHLSGKGRTTAFGLGAQLQYQPDIQAGWHAHAGMRFGIEQGRMDRRLAVANYSASHSADWTGRSVSLQVGAGHRWQLAESVSAGPFASFNYARVSRPATDESGPSGTRLELDSSHADALRSSLGLQARLRHQLENGSRLQTQLQVSWDHEWLDRDVTQGARFAAWPGAGFDTTNQLLPRDSLGLRVGLDWQRNERMSLGLGVSGRLGNGYEALEGQLSLRMAF